jgi:hypothetical protein
LSVAPELQRQRLEPIGLDFDQIRKPQWKALAVRFAFGAAIALAAALVGLRFGPRYGGVFLAFPAVLPAALSMIEKKEGKARADVDAYGAIIGGLGMVAFALVVHALMPAGAVLSVAVGWVAWVAAAGAGFYTARLLLRRLL